MDRPVLMAIVVVFMLLLLALMYLGWRARKKRQGGVVKPESAPAELGRAIGTFEGKYVASTASGDPLDRIAVHGLGFRGNASVLIAESGVLVQIAGTGDIWIPAADVRDLRRGTWTIDRVVEPDGLHIVQWTLGDRIVDSYFRMNEPTAFQKAVERLIAERKPA